MKIVIDADHSGYDLKNKIIEYLKENEIEVINNRQLFEEKDDYPEVAYKVCEKVLKENAKGILICGSGIGISIAANKVNGIRCGTCNEEYLVEMARKDNDINVLAIGARVIDFEKAKKIIDIFLNTEFLGQRHKRRVDEITEIEEKMKEGN